MLQVLKGKWGLVAGCCAASLGVGLMIGGASVWLTPAPPRVTTAFPPPPSHQALRTVPSAPVANDSIQTGKNNLPYARTQDGRLIHPVTGQACPRDMKPIGRRGCVEYCPEENMTYWEDAGRCVPTERASAACVEKGGTWILGVEDQGGRCRVPLTEIDPKARNRLDRLGR
jgi:hypothetical protein